ncbi:hypothetical protein LguiB_006703 [Lonicera macranthoides]
MSRMPTKLPIFSSSLERKKIVSLANGRCDKHVFSVPIEKPSTNPLFFALSIIRLRTSDTNTNKKGDRGSPCLKPLEALKFPLGFPFINSKKLTEDKQPRIHFLHLLPNPFSFNT